MSDPPLTRYRFSLTRLHSVEGDGALVRWTEMDPDGEWVRWAEVEPLLRELTRERDEAVDALRQITLRVEQTAFRRIQDRAQQAEDFR